MSARSRPADWVGAQGNYAGSVSRLTAYLIDLMVISGLFWLFLAFLSFAVQVVTGRTITWHKGNLLVIICYVVWHLFYLGFSWAASGRSLGMFVLGVHVVRADGARLEPRRGWLRALVFPLGFLTLGLGYLTMLVQRERRALYDLVAGTAVVYEWDARAARLRFLAREAEPGHSPGQQ